MLSDNSQITCLWSPKPNFAHSWNSTPWHSTFSRLQVLSRQVQQDVLHLQHPPPPPPGLPGGGAGEENSALASPLLGHTWWLLQVIYPRIVNFCQFMSYMTFIIYQLHFFMKKNTQGKIPSDGLLLWQVKNLHWRYEIIIKCTTLYVIIDCNSFGLTLKIPKHFVQMSNVFVVQFWNLYLLQAGSVQCPDTWHPLLLRHIL